MVCLEQYAITIIPLPLFRCPRSRMKRHNDPRNPQVTVLAVDEMPVQVSQHMSISSPSNTAVSYTVSSRTKTPARLLVYLQHSLRIIVAAYAIVATAAKLQLRFYSELSTHTELLVKWTLLDKFLQLTTSVEWWVLSVTTLITLYLCVRRNYTGQCTYLCRNVFSFADFEKRKACLFYRALVCRHQQARRISFSVLLQHSSLPHRFKILSYMKLSKVSRCDSSSLLLWQARQKLLSCFPLVTRSGVKGEPADSCVDVAAPARRPRSGLERSKEMLVRQFDIICGIQSWLISIPRPAKRRAPFTVVKYLALRTSSVSIGRLCMSG